MSGVLHGVVASLKAAAAAVTDAFFEYVALLLNTTSTNGAQNNTFLDSSTNAFSITRNGNTTQGTFSPFSQKGWSNYFDGTGDYLTIPNNAALQLGSGNFTIEFWIFAQNLSGVQQFCNTSSVSGTTNNSYAILVNGTSCLYYLSSTGTAWDIAGGVSVGSVSNGTWNHIALVRNGNTITPYLNGTAGTTTTSSASLFAFTSILNVGSRDGGIDAFAGYMSNFRIVKGTAVYTSNFTPPTSPLTAITNTSLLTCQSNRFIDNSSNAFAITRNGDVSVQAFSPFNPTAAWSASTNGGSGYFDGTGDYLTAPDNAAFDFGSGDFTVELWYYPTSLPAATILVSKWNAGTYAGSNQWMLYLTSAAATAVISTDGTNAAATITGPNLVLNQWNHVAFARSGNSFTVYTNGVGGTSVTNTGSLYALDTEVLGIGYRRNNGSAFEPLFGYTANIRIVKGTAVYTANFTPPTAPLTAIANTSLLLNFTNAGIFDGAGANNFETVGNAQASTTQAKFGTTSMKFAGGSDWMQTVTKPALRFGTAPFTIEAWLYPTSAATMCVTSIYTGTAGWTWKISGNVIAWYDNTSGNIGGTTAIASNTWTHVAIVREGTGANQFKFYVNGVLDVTSTCSANFTQTANCFVGGEGGATPNFATSVWNGYIDDLRITNGYARYGFFTPPTSALTATAYTGLLANTTTTNGAQNNTFLDGSTNNFSITRNGNTTQGSFSPFSNSGWSNYFDGTGDYLSVASNAAFDLGSSDFTIEAWVNPNSFTNGYAVASRYNFSGSASGWVLRFVNATTLRFIRGNDVLLDATVSASVGVWYHVAVVRNGSTLTIYLNGTQVAQATGIANFTDATTALQIGRTNTVTDDANGYTSNLRIVKGTAVYTSNFTPPTAPLTAITNTSLLTCQSNRFIDNSTNNFTITRNGDTSVQAFSPFTPATYSTSTNGGSGYFDGTGDYLSVADNVALEPGTGDFCLETWVYFNALGIGNIYNAQQSGPSISLNASNQIEFGQSYVSVLLTDTVAATTGQWYHIAVCRSGTSLSMFVNGSRRATATNSTNFNTTVANYIGWNGGAVYFNGYLSNLRLVKGSAVYDPTLTTLTVPTSPLTAITNTQLLLNFTNAGIFDGAGANNFETVGNAQASTTQAKYGTTSMYFDGTGDRLITPATPRLNLASGDFTVECWVYFNNTTGDAMVCYRGAQAITLGTDYQWNIYRTGTSLIVRPYSSTTDYSISVGTIAANTWYHVALTRSGSTFRGFLNGTVSATTQTIAGVLNNSAAWFGITVGNATVSGTDIALNGYIDDLRVTPGQALYTTNFTPPTAPFPVQ